MRSIQTHPRLLGFLILMQVALFGVGAYAVGLSTHRIDAVVRLGETQIVSITISNPGDTTRVVRMSLAGVRTTPNGDIEWLGADGFDGAMAYEYAAIGSVATVSPASVTLLPHESAEVSVSIAAPAAVAEGEFAGRAGAIRFDVTDVQDGMSSLFENVFRLVAFVLVRFDGAQCPTAAPAYLKAERTPAGGVRFLAGLRNLGNVHLTPSGQIVIRDASSGDCVSILFLDFGTSLPGLLREYTGTWQGAALDDGRYIVCAEFDLGTGEPIPGAEYLLTVRDGEVESFEPGS